MSPSSPFSGRQVLVLSSVDWGAAWQRHHALVESFAEAGAEVHFVENTGFRGPGLQDLSRIVQRFSHILSRGRRRKGARVVSPLVLPPTHPLFRAANTLFFVPRLMRRLRRRGLRRDPIVVAYLPTETTLSIMDHLDPSFVIYDCVDNFAGHPCPPHDLADTEAELTRRSDLVLTTSRYLYEQKASIHPRVIELHHGVSPDFFRKGSPPKEHRRLCYFGTVWDALDYGPIRALAKAGFEVSLIGPVKERPPRLPATVRLPGPVPHEDLPSLLDGFDALLLPYTDSDYNKGVMPAKIYECLATGKPVLASPLPSIGPLKDVLYLAKSPAEFVRTARSLDKTETLERREARTAVAREHSTPRQMRKVHNAVSDAMRAERKAPGASAQRTWGLPETGKLFLRGFSWIAIFFAVARAATFLTQFLAARFLGPEQYGTAHLIIAVSMFLEILPMLGFPLALARFGSVEDTEAGRRRLVSTSLSTFILWSAACLAVLIPLSPWLAESARLSTRAWNMTLTYAILTAIHLVAGSALQGLARFKERGHVEAIYGITAFGVLALMLANGHRSFEALIGSFMVGLALSASYALWVIRGYIRLRIDFQRLSETLPFVLLGVVSILSLAFVRAPGRIAAYHFHSATTAGIYSVYFTATAQIALVIAYMINTVIIPITSRAKGQEEAWRMLGRFRPGMAAGLVAFFAVCAAVILLIIGSSYPLRWDWLLLFAIGAAVILIHGVSSALFSARDVRGLTIASVGTLLAGLGNLLFNLLLTPEFGITGAAVSLILGYLLGLGWYSVNRIRQGRAEGGAA